MNTKILAGGVSSVVLGAVAWWTVVHSQLVNPMAEPPVIITESIPNAVCGQPYHAVIQASGFKPFTWSIEMNPPIDWLVMTQVGDDAVLSGTPPADANGECIANQQLSMLRVGLGMK